MQHLKFGKMSDEDLTNLKNLLKGLSNKYENSSHFVSADGTINQILYYDYDKNEEIILETSGSSNNINTSPNINEILSIINKYKKQE